jgi:DNA-binding response OmpR family regulator
MTIRKSTAFIIDDSPTVRFMLKRDFTEIAFKVIGESKDKETTYAGLDKLKDEKISPEIITVDLVIPGVESKDLVKHIRETHPDSKIIIITAFADETAKEEYDGLDSDFFFVKPVKAEQLKMASLHTR